MTDRQISTSDLARRSATDDTDDTDEPVAEARPSDEPLARGRSESDAGDLDDTQDEAREPLLPADQSERFTERWQEIQTSFVDEPRDAVAQADALVADLMQRLAASFSEERVRLESQWDRGDEVSTEDLRVALTRYRSFFDRLLSA
jgi:hypothetical protein